MSSTVMYPATAGQLRRLHQLLNQQGLMGQKADIISNATKGRSTSSKELSYSETKALIQSLEAQSAEPQRPKHQPNDSRQRMINKVFALLHKIGYLEGDTEDDKKINSWIANQLVVRHGHAKPKKLDDYTNAELQKLVNQFESWQHNDEMAQISFALRVELAELKFNTGPNKITRSR